MIILDRVQLDLQLARVWRLQKTVRNAANAIRVQCELDDKKTPKSKHWRAYMVTLTYKDIDGWSPKHITVWQKNIREWLARRGYPMRYVWVAELQKRGAPHYHAIIWVPKCLQLPKSDKRGWWPHGMTNQVESHTPVGYLTKYCSKVDSKVGFPSGMRIHGVGGLTDEGRRVVRWWNMPKATRENAGPDADLVRKVGGGILDRLTGTLYVSDWAMCAVGTAMALVDGAWRVVQRKLVLSRKWAVELPDKAEVSAQLVDAVRRATHWTNDKLALDLEPLEFHERILFFGKFADGES